MTTRNLLIAIFPDELAADSAAAALKDSGLTGGDAIGILVLDSKGKLKENKVGARSTGKGAGVGAALVLLGPVGIGVGVLGGAAAGALHHKGLGLTEADTERITGELTAGKAAVGVLARYEDAPVVAARLTELGGAPETFEVTDEAALQATASDPAEAQTAVPDPSSVSEPAQNLNEPQSTTQQ